MGTAPLIWVCLVLNIVNIRSSSFLAYPPDGVDDGEHEGGEGEGVEAQVGARAAVAASGLIFAGVGGGGGEEDDAAAARRARRRRR